MIVYVDTSAVIKLVVDEPESNALAEELERFRHSDTLVASLLLHTELHCAAHRRLADVEPDTIGAVLSVLALVDVERSDLLTAPLLPGRLRSADAIHLATALRVGARGMVAYDSELSAAAAAAGIRVVSPN